VQPFVAEMANHMKNTFTVVLLLFVAVSMGIAVAKIVSRGPESLATSEAASGGGENKAPSGGLPVRDGVKVYYFHSNTRCDNCRKVEAYGQEAVERGFVDEMKRGQIGWQAVNYETPGNEHYVVDYELVAPNLVLAMFKDRKQVKWTALKEVVDETGDKKAFTNLLQKRLREFIQETASNP
jgi:hypothetical protein